MKFLLIEACLTMICLAPLLLLTRDSMSAWAWLCLPLWMFIMLPARVNAAKDMRGALAGDGLGSSMLIETKEYGGKLLYGLKRVFFLLLWGSPLIAFYIIFRIHFSGEIDSFTVLRMIRNDLGGGDQIRGIWMLVLMVIGALLVLMIGCAFHSGARHAFSHGQPKAVQDHHGRIFLSWLASLLTVLPIVIAIVIVIFRYLPAIRDLNGLLMGTVNLPATKGTILILALWALLTLPLLPLRSLFPAAFVDGLCSLTARHASHTLSDRSE